MYSDIWSIVSALSTFLGALIVSITVIVGYSQLKEMTSARTGEAFTKMVEQLGTPEIAQARKHLATNSLPKPGKVSQKLYEMMRKVWASFDHIGMMVEYKLISERLFMDMYKESVIFFWELLEPYIQWERKKRKGRYQTFFELLYNRCIKFTHLTYSPTEINYIVQR